MAQKPGGSISIDFPSFSEGLSLREEVNLHFTPNTHYFPSFSEGLSLRGFGSTAFAAFVKDFPSFSEGLSLRVVFNGWLGTAPARISLPFRRDFH